MILLDTSVLIQVFDKKGHERIGDLVLDQMRQDNIATNGLIVAEFLAFENHEKRFERLEEDLRGFHWMELHRAIYFNAARLGSALRRKGITVPANDLIIASCAIEYGADLWHGDEHYGTIAAHTDLSERDLRLTR